MHPTISPAHIFICARKKIILLLFVLLVFSKSILAQDSETDRLIDSELKMTFPSIYFKHKSADYAAMPYTVDSCLKYIAINITDVNSFVIWQDSVEMDELTKKRIKKLKAGLNKFTPSAGITIHPMGREQKISRRTIEQADNTKQKQYLLSLNSVFEIAKTRLPKTKRKYRSHLESPRLFCWGCIKSGFHLQSWVKLRKMRKKAKQKK